MKITIGFPKDKQYMSEAELDFVMTALVVAGIYLSEYRVDRVYDGFVITNEPEEEK